MKDSDAGRKFKNSAIFKSVTYITTGVVWLMVILGNGRHNGLCRSLLSQGGLMPKNMNMDNTLPVDRTSKSVGTRGDSAFARNRSGNHFGNRSRAISQRGTKATRTPKSL